MSLIRMDRTMDLFGEYCFSLGRFPEYHPKVPFKKFISFIGYYIGRIWIKIRKHELNARHGL